jgi:hypothetical protein
MKSVNESKREVIPLRKLLIRALSGVMLLGVALGSLSYGYGVVVSAAYPLAASVYRLALPFG